MAPMENKKLSFGNWLQQELDAKGWSQADLAHALGKSSGLINAWVRDHKVPGARSCDALASVLNLDPSVPLYYAGHITELPRPVSYYEHRRELRQLQQNIRRIEQATIGGVVHIKRYGPVPADSTRWSVWEEGDELEPVLEHWVGHRSPNEFLVIEVSGDCLRNGAEGVRDGNLVLIRRLRDGEPNDGALTLVRFHDEYTLKYWSRDGSWITLTDGDQTITDQRSIMDDVDVIGIYVTHWHDPTDSGAGRSTQSG